MAVIVTCTTPGCGNTASSPSDDTANAKCVVCLEEQRKKEEKEEQDRWENLTPEGKLDDLHQRLRKLETAPRNPFPPTDI